MTIRRKHVPSLCRIAAVALVSFGAMPRTAEAQAPGVIAGVVVDSATRQPLLSARVVIEGTGREASTDRAGRFVIGRLRPGEYRATVARLGYADDSVRWAVAAGDTTRVSVMLRQSAIELRALTVQVDKLERRRRASGWSSRAIGRDGLEGFTAMTAAQFVADHFGLARVTCPRGRSRLPQGRRNGVEPRSCLLVRGGVRSPCVLLDESPVDGLDALEALNPDDLYRVEVYDGGAVVQAYTTWFIRNATRTAWSPLSADTQWNLYCVNRPGAPRV
ncbi:MAG TPA: carboxypeptidase regulatory-like domain-containing protein [Longimicrobiaceae bacterium]|nr:carboxypeptidase regulatory-like domain-containing protein [Longimicrobiaceae bacterium]